MTTTEKRANRIFLARLSEQAERYDDMVAQMKEIIEMGGDLSVDERNLLSLAYKNVISKLRVSWSNISAIEQKKESRGSQKHISTIQEYRRGIEDDLETLCQEILRELDRILIPNASTGDSMIFYYKMKGDYCRYLAEFLSGEKRSAAVTSAENAYKTATDIARTELTPTHPLRLGVALNFSVFYYEILSSPDHACDLARRAFDDAINELDSLTEEFYADSTLAMQRLRDNLSLWMSLDSDEPELRSEGLAEEAAAET